MNTLFRPLWLLLTGLMLALHAAAATPAVEAAKIEALISEVAHLQGAAFIRNGSEHTPVEAAEHLRMKWEKAGKRVATAEDFIRLCASQSYLTKKHYQIRFADGRILDAGPWLRQQLGRLPPTVGGTAIAR